MKGKHAQKKNFGAVGTIAPTPLSLKTRGGVGGAGGVAYNARPPPSCSESGSSAVHTDTMDSTDTIKAPLTISHIHVQCGQSGGIYLANNGTLCVTHVPSQETEVADENKRQQPVFFYGEYPSFVRSSATVAPFFMCATHYPHNVQSPPLQPPTFSYSSRPKPTQPPLHRDTILSLLVVLSDRRLCLAPDPR